MSERRKLQSAIYAASLKLGEGRAVIDDAKEAFDNLPDDVKAANHPLGAGLDAAARTVSELETALRETRVQ